jgi:uncharacterized protein (DUF885 family)
VSTAASAPLSNLAARFWQFQCREFPLTAILAGEATPDATLFRESGADHDCRYGAAAAMLAELDAITEFGLTAQDRATRLLLRHELESLRLLHEVAAHQRPSLFPNGPAMMVTHFANTASIGGGESAEVYLERLASVPAYLRDVAENLRAGYRGGTRYPRVVLDCAIAATRGAVAGPVEAQPWPGPFTRSAAAGRESVRRLRERTLALVRDEIAPAFEQFAELLVGPLAEGARSTVACSDAPLGRELYAALVRTFTTTAATPEEIHARGLAEIERLEAGVAAVTADAGYAGDLAEYRRFLASPEFIAPSKEALRERIESLSKRIDARIPAFFGRIPRITYGVESMPESVAERMPPAYAQPNPADRTAPGVHWVTSIPARFPAYLYLPVALHEAWPGHLMHFALMQEAEDLPAFRRHGGMRYSACIEGWALYCEGLGVDMGLYRTPHDHYGQLESELWRALRLVVDTGIHAHSWSRERAIETMARSMALPLATITAEVDRYISWPGQALVYQIGNLAFRGLRRRAEARLGERFSHRAFHDALMAAGAVTLPVLEDLLEDWMEREAARLGESEARHAPR